MERQIYNQIILDFISSLITVIINYQTDDSSGRIIRLQPKVVDQHVCEPEMNNSVCVTRRDVTRSRARLDLYEVLSTVPLKFQEHIQVKLQIKVIKCNAFEMNDQTNGNAANQMSTTSCSDEFHFDTEQGEPLINYIYLRTKKYVYVKNEGY